MANLGLVDRIYEAAVIPELWPETLEQLSHVADGSAGALVAIRGDGHWAHLSSRAYRAGYDDYLVNGAEIENVRPRRHLERQYPGFLADRELCSDAELKSDPIYHRFLRPHGLGWTAGTVVTSPGGDMLVIDVANALGHAPFTRQQMHRLDRMRPHLARATLLAARLGLRAARNVTEAMQVLGLPAIALSPNGRVVSSNALAEALDGRISFRAFNRLSLGSAAADTLLAELLAGQRISGAGRSIPLAAEGDWPPLIIHSIPVRGAANDIFAAAVTVLLVTAVRFPQPPSASLLAGLFDLTPAEARIARNLTEGSSLEQIALFGGVSVQTVRNQLRSVFAKTGTARQAELTALIAGSMPFPMLHRGSDASSRQRGTR